MLDSMLRAIYSAIAPAGAKGRLSTLIFHRVLAAPDPLLPSEPSAAEFEARMRWVQRHFNVIPLAEAVTRLQSGTLPTRALAITFDDGYADNQQIAAPILRKLGLPATFFIATGYLDGGCMFNDSIIAALRDCKRGNLDLSEIGLGIHSLESLEHRRRAVSVLLPQVKVLDPARRAGNAERICQLAEVVPPDDLMMTSSQVAALARDDFGIGGHTVNHPILARLDPNHAREEIHHGRQRLEEIAHSPVRLFAYPNGRPGEDYTVHTTEQVRQLGFAAAFTTAHGVAGSNADLFQLPRFTPWDRGELKFGARMARNLLNASPSVAVR
jgi:peptidoglycan/xylan/chitin deacetylase (PgdA/CDA1 family)